MGLYTLLAASAGGLLVLAWVLYPAVRVLGGLGTSLSGQAGGAGTGSGGTDRASNGASGGASDGVSDDPAVSFSVAVILATRDDPERVGKKVRSILDSSASEHVVGFAVGVDPTSQWSLDQYQAVSTDSRVAVVQGDLPGGKANALNAAETASPPSDFLLIVDTSQTLADDAIVLLARSIRGLGWAGASGVVLPEKQGAAGKIWQVFELGIRSGQAAAKGLVTTSGAITMLRRDEWRAIPSGTICDDLFLTMGAASRGGKVGLCTDAVAIDPRRVAPREGFGKRVRTLTGLWQYILVLDPSCLNPFRNRLWVDFVFHKIMRILTPFLFVVAVAAAGMSLASDGWEWPFGPLWVWLAGAAILMVAALASESWRWRLATLFSPVLSTWNAYRGNWNVWDVSKS